MTDRTDIFITGVGGQGSLSASRFLGEAAVKTGLKVLVGEIHGMAQRGGIVESTVRIGDVYGPIIPDGKASPQTLIITNTHPIVPATVSMKGDKYPEAEEVLERIRAISPRVIALDATEMAGRAGNTQALNAVLLGVLAGTGVLPFESAVLRDVLMANVPKRALQVNEKAFAMGLEVGATAACAEPA
jgi:indolepyruvate ferredoxin oxidoreductase beta subunit